MVNLRHPFRLNVGFIIHEEVGYTCDFPFEFAEIKLEGDLELRDFSGALQIGRTPQGLVVLGRFAARTTLECVRCLKDFEQTLAWDVTELYAFNEKSVSESGLFVPENAQIDFESLIREYALLEVPISPICRDGCRGLCPVCGQDLNIADCGHRPHADESPFSVLKKLL